eukprot:scaffold265339_cov37-Tisochrysis_lutea.AAC.1
MRGASPTPSAAQRGRCAPPDQPPAVVLFPPIRPSVPHAGVSRPERQSSLMEYFSLTILAHRTGAAQSEVGWPAQAEG